MSNLHTVPEIVTVYGGQWGSEGKGQVLAAFARDQMHARPGLGVYAVRVGAPNAGHTARMNNGDLRAVQSVPVPAFLDYGVQPVIGAGGMVNLHILERELKLREHYLPGDTQPLIIDPLAMVVTEAHVAMETMGKLQDKIGSTREGVGAALAEKITRDGVRTFGDFWADGHLPAIIYETCMLEDTVRLLNNSDRPVWIEGTQGHLLSIHTSGYYPFATSRECGPQGIMADIGLSPFAASSGRFESIAVFRTYPIRVGGNSGGMGDEITWDELREESDGYVAVPEITTVTKRQRRIARWSMDLARRTVIETRPTFLAITFLDYLFPETARVKDVGSLSVRCCEWLHQISDELSTPILYVSTGAGQENCFFLDL